MAGGPNGAQERGPGSAQHLAANPTTPLLMKRRDSRGRLHARSNTAADRPRESQALCASCCCCPHRQELYFSVPAPVQRTLPCPSRKVANELFLPQLRRVRRASTPAVRCG